MSYYKKFRKITPTLRWIDPCVVRSGQLLSVPPTCVISFLRLAEWLLVVGDLSLWNVTWRAGSSGTIQKKYVGAQLFVNLIAFQQAQFIGVT